MTKRLTTFILVLFMAGLLNSPLFAEDYEVNQDLPHCGICQHAESTSYMTSWWGKITRGLVNTGFGWTNLFAQPKKSISDGDNLFKGIGKGFGYAGLRTVQGVTEIVIFWLPPVHDEPLKNCAFGDLGITGR